MKRKATQGDKSTGTRTASSRRTHVRLTNETVFGMIQERAYNIYCQRGNNPGDQLSDWLAAEYQVATELKDMSKKAVSRATGPRTTLGRIPRRTARS